MTPRPSYVRVLILAAIVTVVLGARLAEASTILAPKSDGWQYTFCNPTSDLQWKISTSNFHANVGCSDAEPGGWSTGAAPFGNAIGGGGTNDFDWQTRWDVDVSDPTNLSDDLWVRRAIDFSGYDLSTIRWDLGVDNGFALYLNGTLVQAVNAEGFAQRWEYGGFFNPLNFVPGLNYLALALEDHGGMTAFDMQITGTPLAEAPEPVTLALLGLGSLGLLASRKRLF